MVYFTRNRRKLCYCLLFLLGTNLLTSVGILSFLVSCLVQSVSNCSQQFSLKKKAIMVEITDGFATYGDAVTIAS